MKKLLLTLGLIGCTVASALADGTIFVNTTGLNRIRLGLWEQERFATASDNLTFGIFYGSVEGGFAGLTVAPQLAYVTGEAGVLSGWPSVMGLPGTQGGDTVLLQVRAWNETFPYEFHSRMISVSLGAEAGPGTVIFGSGTNPNRMPPILYPVPEPSVVTIGALGITALTWMFRRRTSTNH